jgi:hypothetical protein
VEVVAPGVLDEPDVVEPALMSVGAAEPEAPMEVPLPVVEPVVPAAPVVPPMLEPVPVDAPAVVSVVPVVEPVVEPVVPIEPEPVVPPAVVLLVSLGDVVVEGVVVELVDDEVSVDEVAASSFLPQALRDRAAIRARAAHCAIGDLIIRNSLRVSFRGRSELTALSALPAAHFSGRSLRRCRLSLSKVVGHFTGGPVSS